MSQFTFPSVLEFFQLIAGILDPSYFKQFCLLSDFFLGKEEVIERHSQSLILIENRNGVQEEM